MISVGGVGKRRQRGDHSVDFLQHDGAGNAVEGIDKVRTKDDHIVVIFGDTCCEARDGKGYRLASRADPDSELVPGHHVLLDDLAIALQHDFSHEATEDMASGNRPDASTFLVESCHVGPEQELLCNSVSLPPLY